MFCIAYSGTMFIVADSAQAELLRVMDGDHLYVTYDVKDDTVSAHDYYEAGGEGVYLDIYKDYELVDSYELATSGAGVSYNDSDGALYKFSVRNESGVDITVKEIVFN